jgi:hypothetical protein
MKEGKWNKFWLWGMVTSILELDMLNLHFSIPFKSNPWMFLVL